MRARAFGKSIAWVVCLFLLGSLMLPSVSQAKTAREIDASVNAALDRFMKQVKGSREFLRTAKGVLLGSASIGLQLGVQQKDIILVFLQDKALKDFRAKEGWQVGVDGSVVIVDLGVQASIDSTKLNQPIVGFVSSQKGLMYNLTLEGSKITKLQK